MVRPALSGAVIANAAVRYRGSPYRWGGGGPFPTPGGDCSGLVNWVLGHDLGLTLPGGVKNFNGGSHGPVVLAYAAWTSAKRVSSPQQGDLCIWAGPSAAGHIGIAISATQMISALDQAQGVAVTPIKGHGPPSPFMVKRITAAAQGGAGGIVPASTAAGFPFPCLVTLALAPFVGAWTLAVPSRRAAYLAAIRQDAELNSARKDGDR